MTQTRTHHVAGAIIAVALISGCGNSGTNTPGPKDYGDITGVEEIGQQLGPISGTTTFTGTAMAIWLTAAETTIVSKHAVSGAILINDVPVYTDGGVLATATNTKTIDIVGSGTGADLLIMDFANGTFAPGAAARAGIKVDFTGDYAHVFKMRATSGNDTVTFGGTNLATNIAFNVDAYKDIAVTSVGPTNVVYTVSLGAGNDIFNASNIGATAALSFGTQTASAPFLPYSGNLTVYGGIGNDVLTGGSGNDTLYGDSGNDVLSGGLSSTTTNGNSGDDVFFGGSESDGGTGNDTVTYIAVDGGTGAGFDLTVQVGPASLAAAPASGVSGESDDIRGDVETVIGGSGNDTFSGNAGDQTFFGGPGDDLFLMGDSSGTSTGLGNDTVWGGAGIDTVDYSSRTAAVTVTMDGLAANDGDVALVEKDNIKADVEGLKCPLSNVTCIVTGNALNNLIYGGLGSDTLTGGAGDDTFYMGSATGTGADVISGGIGIDTVSFVDWPAAVTMTMDGQAGTNTDGKTIDATTENFICPATLACTISGNVLNNNIIGSSAADTILGLGGDDRIESGGGGDTVDCGDGSDILIGGATTTTACEL